MDDVRTPTSSMGTETRPQTGVEPLSPGALGAGWESGSPAPALASPVTVADSGVCSPLSVTHAGATQVSSPASAFSVPPPPECKSPTRVRGDTEHKPISININFSSINNISCGTFSSPRQEQTVSMPEVEHEESVGEDTPPRQASPLNQGSDADANVHSYRYIQRHPLKSYAMRNAPKSPGNYESIDYDTTASLEGLRAKQENDHRAASSCISAKTQHTVLTWVLSLAIAVTVAAASYGLTMGVKSIHDLKESIVESGMHHGVGVGYVYSLSVWLCLTAIAAALTYWAPAAAGSGIPQVKGFLNGVNIPEIMTMRTFVAKSLGIIACLGIGFPAGREGPMVQIGASIGAGLSRGYSKLLCGADAGERMRLYDSTDTPGHRRDFVSVGSACGVAAAFGAPIGGILFAIEEVASYWSPALTFQAFASACVAGYMVGIFLSGASIHDEGWVLFGEGGPSHEFKTWEIAFFFVVAIGGGLIGSLYNHINTITMRLRKRFLLGHKLRKVLEAFVIIICIMSIFFWMSHFWPCSEKPTDDEFHKTGIHFVSFTCKEGEFNQMATLALNPQERVLFQLYSRKTGGYFGADVLGLFLVTYFLLASITFGIAVPSGLFIPSMIIGATWGRLCGEVLHGWIDQVDPGVYALVGAASSLGGITRMTMSLAAILIETTNDIELILPVMLALVVSKTIGDLFNESIYELVLHSMGVNILPSEPPAEINLQMVNDVMTHDPEVLSKVTKVGAVYHALSRPYNAFPVISGDRESPTTFCGLVTRDQLEQALMGVRTCHDHFKHPKEKDSLELSIDNDVNIDLRNYMTLSPLVVFDTTPLLRAFRLFRCMGLRHLCVITHSHHLVGIVTRTDLAKPPHTTSLTKEHHSYPAVYSRTEEAVRYRQGSTYCLSAPQSSVVLSDCMLVA